MKRLDEVCTACALCAGLVLLAAGCGDEAPSEKPAAPPSAAAASPPAAAPPSGGAPSADGSPGASPPGATATKASPGGTAAPPGGVPGAQKAPPTVALTPVQAMTREKLIELAHKRPFTQQDFVPVAQTNTDPFHDNLAAFVVTPPPAPPMMSCILAKYAIEELKLTAIVLGTNDFTQNRAMFIDGAGVGHFIKRGDRVGKACATVQRILSDRVLFEFTEEVDGKKRTTVRAVELHAKSDPAAGANR